MTSPMSKGDGDGFRARWEAFARREREELRAMSPEDKFRQTAALFASAQAFGWSEALASEEEAVRARWKRIREVLGGR